MKKSILAVAIPALLAANSAFAYDIVASDDITFNINGDIDLKIGDYDDNADTRIQANLDDLDISVSYVVSPDLTVFASADTGADFSDDDTATMDAYGAKAGMSGAFGTVTFGDLGLPGDDMGVGVGNAFDGYADIIADDGHQEAMRYDYSADMFSVALGYGVQAGTLDRTQPIQVNIFGDFGAVELGAFYGVDEDNYSQYSLQASYDITAELNVAADFYSIDYDVDANDKQSYSFNAAYAIDAATSLYLGYASIDFDDSDAADDEVTVLGASYAFSDYVTGYVEMASYDEADLNKYELGLGVDF